MAEDRLEIPIFIKRMSDVTLAETFEMTVNKIIWDKGPKIIPENVLIFKQMQQELMDRGLMKQFEQKYAQIKDRLGEI